MNDFFIKTAAAQPAQQQPASENFDNIDKKRKEEIFSLSVADNVPDEIVYKLAPDEQKLFLRAKQLADQYRQKPVIQNINDVTGIGPDGLPSYEKLDWQSAFARDPFVKQHAPEFSNARANYSGRPDIFQTLSSLAGGIVGAPFRWVEPYRQQFGQFGGPWGNAALYAPLFAGAGWLGASGVNALAGRDIVSAPVASILALLAGAGYGGYYGHNMRKYPLPRQQKRSNFFDAKDDLISQIRESSAPAKAKAQAIKDVYAMKRNEAKQLQAAIATLGTAGAAAAAMHSMFGSDSLGKLLLNAAASGFAGMAGQKLFGPAY